MGCVGRDHPSLAPIFLTRLRKEIKLPEKSDDRGGCGGAGANGVDIGGWRLDGSIVSDKKRSNVNCGEPWYLGADEQCKRRPGIPTVDNLRTGACAAMIDGGMDLHELRALMAPRLNHTVGVDRLLGFENRTAMTTLVRRISSARQCWALERRWLVYRSVGERGAGLRSRGMPPRASAKALP